MAMDVTAQQGGKKRGRARPEMNVTPLVDVVLVLLIIFMVIAPMLGKQFWVHYPDQRRDDQHAAEPVDDDDGPVVVSVDAQGRIRINRDHVTEQDLSDRVRRILVARQSRTIFFDAADGADFGRAVAVMDLLRAGGATTIAVATEALD